MTRKPRTAGSDSQGNLDRVKAYQRVFGEAGGATRDDRDIVLTDLLSITGYYRPPSYAAWMAKTKTPQGFELHCALSASRAEVMAHIMGFLSLSDDQMIALEKAVRQQRAG